MLQFCSLHYFSKFLVKFSLMAHFWYFKCWQAIQKRLPLPPWAGAVVTEQRIEFWILLKSLHQRHPWPKVHAWCITTQYIQSLDPPWEGRAPRKSLTVTACHWVVKGHPSPLLRWGLLTVRLGRDIERWSVLWHELGLIALLLFSAGSRTIFTQTGKTKQNNTKAELEDNNFFVFCLVRW